MAERHTIDHLRAGIVLALLAIAWLPLSRANSAQIVDVVDVEIVQRLTGPHLSGHVGVGGTDLGHMVNHKGLTYFLFGDTFSSEYPGDDWRSSAMAYTLDRDPTDGLSGIRWLTDNTGMARELIHSGEPVVTEIPTGAISVNGRIYSWYMAVDYWGLPGEWYNDHAGLAHWDRGEPEFTIVDSFRFPGDSNFGMVAASLRTDPGANDDHLYLWGTPAGRFGGVKLARVDPLRIEDINAYEYFAGYSPDHLPLWVDSEFDAPLIVEPTVGEMSVMYNQALDSWTMLYFSADEYALEVRQAPEPWGPWSDPIRVVSGHRPGFHQLYGSYMNPLYVEDDGQTIYFTMSLWDPYDVYLAKATFVTIPDPGDYDGNGIVDAADYTIWRDSLGQQGTSLAADGNHDQIIDFDDFLIWKQNFGAGRRTSTASATSAVQVPETSTLLSVLIGAIVLLSVRPRAVKTPHAGSRLRHGRS